MSYLLGITIGPVQTFIEESKKLSDLYNSSKIMSDIMREIVNYVSIQSKNQSNNYEIIYPNIDKEKNEVDFSNYLIIQLDNIIDMKNIEDSIYKKIINKYPKVEESKFDVKDLKENFNLFWAFEEVEDDSKYADAYKNLTTLISDLKNTYEFDLVEQEANKKKCSICGKRNAIYNCGYEEELCNLCFFKRKYSKNNKEGKFESVYDISVKVWEKNNDINLDNEISKKYLDKNKKYYNYDMVNNLYRILNDFMNKDKKENTFIKDIKPKVKYKYSKVRDKYLKVKDKYLFEKKQIQELYQDIYEKDNNNKTLKEVIQDLGVLKNELKNLYKSEENSEESIKEKIEKPSLEYAFIKLDVDNLGKWMSGKFFDKYFNNEKSLKCFQSKLSKYLIDFASKIKDEIGTQKDFKYCSVIYAGGDDLLAVLPTENIIIVMDKVKACFEKNVLEKLKKEFYLTKDITYSASITIASCTDPMSYALTRNRIELENVKNKFEGKEPEKDGLAINYIVNTGREITAYIDKSLSYIFFNIITSYKKFKDKLSLSYLRNLQKEILTLNNIDITWEEVRSYVSIVLFEYKRLINRSISKKEDTQKNLINRKDFNKEKVCNMNEYIEAMELFLKQILCDNVIEVGNNRNNLAVENIVNILDIIERLSKKDFEEVGDKEYEQKE